MNKYLAWIILVSILSACVHEGVPPTSTPTHPATLLPSPSQTASPTPTQTPVPTVIFTLIPKQPVVIPMEYSLEGNITVNSENIESFRDYVLHYFCLLNAEYMLWLSDIYSAELKTYADLKKANEEKILDITQLPLPEDRENSIRLLTGSYEVSVEMSGFVLLPEDRPQYLDLSYIKVLFIRATDYSNMKQNLYPVYLSDFTPAWMDLKAAESQKLGLKLTVNEDTTANIITLILAEDNHNNRGFPEDGKMTQSKLASLNQRLSILAYTLAILTTDVDLQLPRIQSVYRGKKYLDKYGRFSGRGGIFLNDIYMKFNSNPPTDAPPTILILNENQ